jgi:hypothetical protein
LFSLSCSFALSSSTSFADELGGRAVVRETVAADPAIEERRFLASATAPLVVDFESDGVVRCSVDVDGLVDVLDAALLTLGFVAGVSLELDVVVRRAVVLVTGTLARFSAMVDFLGDVAEGARDVLLAAVLLDKGRRFSSPDPPTEEVALWLVEVVGAVAVLAGLRTDPAAGRVGGLLRPPPAVRLAVDDAVGFVAVELVEVPGLRAVPVTVLLGATFSFSLVDSVFLGSSFSVSVSNSEVGPVVSSPDKISDCVVSSATTGSGDPASAIL